MKILVVNAGSSSLKYQLIDMQTEKVLAKGGCERIGIRGAFLKAKGNGGEKNYGEENSRQKRNVGTRQAVSAPQAAAERKTKEEPWKK